MSKIISSSGIDRARLACSMLCLKGVNAFFKSVNLKGALTSPLEAPMKLKVYSCRVVSRLWPSRKF